MLPFRKTLMKGHLTVVEKVMSIVNGHITASRSVGSPLS